jgi:phosphotransferase system enzyme I (PtsI)
LAHYRKKLTKLHEVDIELAKLKDLPAKTLDGKKIDILGNLDLSEELDFIIQNGGEGIGLMRTEQIFQEYDYFPSEEEQYEIYSAFAEKLYPLPLTIRAFDIGGDKVLPVDVKEPNPMLGWRGIRFLLDNQKLFKSQIKAVLRASKHKNIKFMIPMVSSILEIKLTKELIEKYKGELKEEGIEFDEHLQVGIMVEVPSAALMISDFAEEVDFFSIGTNDLIQYMLAVDRGNDIVTQQYQEFHPAIIRTLRYIITEAKKSNTHVNLCGEMAADYKAIPLLVGLGLDSISVSSSVILHAKKIIRSLDYSEISSFVSECLKCKTEKEIHEKLENFYAENFSESSEEFYSN